MINHFSKLLKDLKKLININNPPIVLNNNNDENEMLSKTYAMGHSECHLISDTTSRQFKILILDKIKIKINVNADSYVGLYINSSFTLVKVINICLSKS